MTNPTEHDPNAADAEARNGNPHADADGVIHEPENSTVDDWFGQNVARDQEVADGAQEAAADPAEAEEIFDEEADGEERYEAGHPRPDGG